jgi:hypothetical protein
VHITASKRLSYVQAQPPEQKGRLSAPAATSAATRAGPRLETGSRMKATAA